MHRLATVMAIAITVAACGGGGTTAPAASAAGSAATSAKLTKDVTFRIGHTSANSSILELDSLDFIKKITDASGGKITGKSYPAGQLGKQQEMVEQVQVG